jgi:hypothetical protein
MLPLRITQYRRALQPTTISNSRKEKALFSAHSRGQVFTPRSLQGAIFMKPLVLAFSALAVAGFAPLTAQAADLGGGYEEGYVERGPVVEGPPVERRYYDYDDGPVVAYYGPRYYRPYPYYAGYYPYRYGPRPWYGHRYWGGRGYWGHGGYGGHWGGHRGWR